MRGQQGAPRISLQGEGITKQLLGLLSLVAFSMGCHDTSDVTGGWLIATIRQTAAEPESVTAFQGTGDFHVGKDPGAGAAVAFGLTSKGAGINLGQILSLHRPGSGRPDPGRYELAPLRTEAGHLEGFTAYYHGTSAGRSESFTALSGQVEIRESSSARVEGVFQFTAVLYCSVAAIGPSPDDWCQEPNTITPGARQVEVSGSFSAVPVKEGPETPSVP